MSQPASGWQTIAPSFSNSTLNINVGQTRQNGAVVTFDDGVGGTGIDTSTATARAGEIDLLVRKFVRKSADEGEDENPWYNNDLVSDVDWGELKSNSDYGDDEFNVYHNVKPGVLQLDPGDTIDYLIVVTRQDSVDSADAYFEVVDEPIGIGIDNDDDGDLDGGDGQQDNSYNIQGSGLYCPASLEGTLLPYAFPSEGGMPPSRLGDRYNCSLPFRSVRKENITPTGGKFTNTVTLTYNNGTTDVTQKSEATTQLDVYDVTINLFEDTDRNGVYDAGTENLITGSGVEALLDPPSGSDQTISLNSGTVTLTDQLAGSYTTSLVGSNTTICAALSGYSHTTVNTSNIVECQFGDYRLTQTISNNSITFDFGFVRSYDLTLEIYEVEPNGSGGYALVDSFDPLNFGSSGAPNTYDGSITVNITGPSGAFPNLSGRTIARNDDNPFSNWGTIVSAGNYEITNWSLNSGWLQIDSGDILGAPGDEVATASDSSTDDTMYLYIARSSVDLFKYVYNGSSWTDSTPPAVSPGGSIDYLVVVENGGAGTLSNFDLTDSFSGTTDIIQSVNTTSNEDGSAIYSSTNDQIAIAFDSIPDGTNGTFDPSDRNSINPASSPQLACQENYCYTTYRVNLVSTFSQPNVSLGNSVSIGSFTGGGGSSGGGGTTIPPVIVEFEPEIDASKDTAYGTSPLVPGESFGYTLSITNSGSSTWRGDFSDNVYDVRRYADFVGFSDFSFIDSNGLEINDPDGLAGISCTPPPINYLLPSSSHVLRCFETGDFLQRLELSAGETFSVRINFTMRDSADWYTALDDLAINNDITIPNDIDPSNDAALPFQVRDLIAKKSFRGSAAGTASIQPPIPAGNCQGANNEDLCTAVWEITLTNIGGSVANVGLVDYLPLESTFRSAQIISSSFQNGQNLTASCSSNVSPPLPFLGDRRQECALRPTIQIGPSTGTGSTVIIEVQTYFNAQAAPDEGLVNIALAQADGETFFTSSLGDPDDPDNPVDPLPPIVPPPIELRGYIWQDTNEDGVIDVPNESNISLPSSLYNRLEVELYDLTAGGAPIATSSVNSVGLYTFPNFQPDLTHRYQIRLNNATLDENYELISTNYQGNPNTSQSGLSCLVNSTCTTGDGTFGPYANIGDTRFTFRADGTGISATDAYDALLTNGQEKNWYNFGLAPKTGELRVKVRLLDENGILEEFPSSASTNLSWWLNGPASFGDYRHSDNQPTTDARYYPEENSSSFQTVPIGNYLVNSISAPGYISVGSSANRLCTDLGQTRTVNEGGQQSFTLCLKPSQLNLQVDKYVCTKPNGSCNRDDWSRSYNLGEVEASVNDEITFLVVASNRSVTGADVTIDILDAFEASDAEYISNRSSLPLRINDVELIADENADPSAALTTSYTSAQCPTTDVIIADSPDYQNSNESVKAYCYTVELNPAASEEVVVNATNTAKIVGSQDQTLEYDGDSAQMVFSYTAQLDQKKEVAINGSSANSGDIVRPGDIITYTLTVENTGIADKLFYRFQDDISNVLTHAEFLSAEALIATPGGVVANGPSFVTNAGRLDWGVVTRVRAGSTLSASFQVQVTDSENWPAGNYQLSNSFGNTINLSSQDIDVDKVALTPEIPPPYSENDPGDSRATFRIRVYNRSNTVINDVTVNDTTIQFAGSVGLVLDQTLVGPAATQDINDGTVQWTIPQIQPNSYEEIQFTVENHDLFFGEFTNTVLATTPTGLSDEDTSGLVTIRQPLAKIEGYVWLDNAVDGSGDSEAWDGYIDDTEEGISGVTVRLLDEFGRVQKEVRTNASGYYQISDPDLRIGDYARVQVVPDRSIYNVTGTNIDGVVQSFLIQERGERYPAPINFGGPWQENTELEIPLLTPQSLENTYNFGLDRLTGTLKVVIKDIYTGEIYKNINNPGIINFAASPDGLFPSQDLSLPSNPLTIDPNHVGDTGACPAPDEEDICDNAGIGTEEGFYHLYNMPTGSYQVTFVPPFGANDVTPLAATNPYQATLLANETEVIDLWIAGEEELTLDKYVWDPTATNSIDTGLWVKNRDAIPGEKIHYLIVASNAGNQSVEVALDDVLPLYELFSSRNHTLRELIAGQEIPGLLGQAPPDANDSLNFSTLFDTTRDWTDISGAAIDGIENCASDVNVYQDENYIVVGYCEDLANSYFEGNYRANNIARYGTGVLASSQAVVNVEFVADVEVSKSHCLWDPALNICENGPFENSDNESEPYLPGDFVRYQITVDNDINSTAPLRDYDVLDDISDVIAYADIFPDSITGNGIPVGQSILWENIFLNQGETIELEYTAIIRDSDTWTRDEYIMDNAANGVHAPRAYMMDLKVEKTPNFQTINPSDFPNREIVNWTITVENRSNTSLAPNTLRIKDILDDYKFVTGNTSGFEDLISPTPNFDLTDDTDDYPLFTYENEFAPNSTIILNVQTESDDLFSGSFTNTAQVQRRNGSEWQFIDSDDAQVDIAVPQLRLEGYVWQDGASCPTIGVGTNCDSRIDGGEPGIANVLMELRDETGSVLYDRVYTDANGHYEFFNVVADQAYRIYQIQPADYDSSGTNQGGEVGNNATIQFPLTGAQTNGSTWIQVGSGPNGMLTYTDSQDTYNFGEVPHLGDLQVYVWPVINGVRSTTPVDYSSLDIAWTVTGPNNFVYSKQTSDTSVQPFNLTNLTTGFYNALLTSFPSGWTDVTNLIVGCNRTAEVQRNNTGIINLCISGESELELDKHVYDYVSESWVTEASFENGQEVHYAVRIWNTGTTDINNIDIMDQQDNPNLLDDFHGNPADLSNINLNYVRPNDGVCIPGDLNTEISTSTVVVDGNNVDLPTNRQQTIDDPNNRCWRIVHYSYLVKTEYVREGTFTNINLATFNDGAGNIGSDSALIRVQFEADPELSKTMEFSAPASKAGQIPSNNLPAQRGDVIRYTLSTENVGNAPLTNWYIRDNLSDVIPYVNNRNTDISSPDGGVLAGLEYIWGPFDINPGDTEIVELLVTVGSPQNWNGSDLYLTNAYGSCNGTPGLCVVPLIDLAMTKRALSPLVDPSSADGVADGGTTVWEISVVNNSEISLDSSLIDIVDNYDNRLQYDQMITPANTVVVDTDNGTDQVIFDYQVGNDFPPGATRIIRYETTNTERYATSPPLLNCAHLEYSGSQYGAEQCATVLVDEVFDLDFDKELVLVDGLAPPVEVDIDGDGTNDPNTLYVDRNAGHTLTYEFFVTNNSNFDFVDLNLTDYLPADTNFQQFNFLGISEASVTDSNGVITVLNSGDIITTTDINGRVHVSFESINLAEGSTFRVRYEVNVPPTIGEKCDFAGYPNYLELEYQGDIVAAAADTITLCGRDMDLRVKKTDNVSTLNAGEQTTYEIFIENIGRDDATNVTLTDTLPTNRSTTFVPVISELEIYRPSTNDTEAIAGTVSGSIVTWPNGLPGFTLEAGGYGRATVTVQVASNAMQNDQFTNTVSIQSGDTTILDVDVNNNEDTDTNFINTSSVRLQKFVGLDATAGAQSETARTGQTAYFRIQATNEGQATTTIDIVDSMRIATDSAMDPTGAGATELDQLISRVIVNGQSVLRDPLGNRLNDLAGDPLNVPDENQWFLVADDVTLTPGEVRSFIIEVQTTDFLTIPVDIAPTSGNIHPVTGFVSGASQELIENTAALYDDDPVVLDIITGSEDQASLFIEAQPEILYTKSALDLITELPIDNVGVYPGQEIIYVLTATNIGSAPAINFQFEDDVRDVIDNIASGTELQILEYGDTTVVGDDQLGTGTYVEWPSVAGAGFGTGVVSSSPHPLPIEQMMTTGEPTRYFQFKIEVGEPKRFTDLNGNEVDDNDDILDADGDGYIDGTNDLTLNNVLNNLYTPAENNPFINPADANVTLEVKAPELEITKTLSSSGAPGGGRAYYGDIVSYTIQVRNVGNYVAENIRIFDELPLAPDNITPALQYAGNTRGATTHHPTKLNGAPLDPTTDRQLVWTDDTNGTPFRLEPNDPPLEITFDAIVSIPNPGPDAIEYNNFARVDGQDPRSSTTYNATSQSAELFVEPFPDSDVTLDKGLDGQTVASGSEVTWTIEITNDNTIRDETNLFLVDLLPSMDINGIDYPFTAAQEAVGNAVVYKRATIVIEQPGGGSPQIFTISPQVLNSGQMLAWPNDANGFTLPRGGTIRATIFADAPSIPGESGSPASYPFINRAELRLGSPQGPTFQSGSSDVLDTSIINVEPEPYVDLRINKEVFNGFASPADPFIDGPLNFATIPADPHYITYKITTYNMGTQSTTVRLSDTIDFTSVNSIYDEVQLFTTDGLATNTPFNTLNDTLPQASVVLNNSLLVPAGTSASNTCTDCVYYLVAKLRSDNFLGANPTHINTARVQDLNTSDIVEDTVQVDVAVSPPQLVIDKQVKMSYQAGGYSDEHLFQADPVDPANPSADVYVEYRYTLTNEGDMPSEAIDVVDFIDASSIIFSEISTPDPAAPDFRTFPGSISEIPIAQNISVAGGETIIYELRGKLVKAFSQQSPVHINEVQLLKSGKRNELTDQAKDASVENALPSKDPNHHPYDAYNRDHVMLILDVEPEVVLTKRVRNVTQDPTGGFTSTSVTAQPGDMVEYEVTAQNIGQVTAESLVITDVLDNTSNITGVTDTLHTQAFLLSGDSDADGTNGVFLALDDYRQVVLNRPLAAGESQSFTIRTVLRNPFPDENTRDITNTVSATIANPGLNPIADASTTVDVIFTPRPAIRKEVTNVLTNTQDSDWHDADIAADALVVEPGDSLRYRISVWNVETGGTVLNFGDLFTFGNGSGGTLVHPNPLDLSSFAFDPDVDGDGLELTGAANFEFTQNALLLSYFSNAQTLFVPGNTDETQAQQITFDITLDSTIGGVGGWIEDDLIINQADYQDRNDASIADNDQALVEIHIPTAELVFTKTAINLSQSRFNVCGDATDTSCDITGNEVNAESTTAKPGEVIQYQLEVENVGDANYPSYQIRDALDDVLEYATLDETTLIGAEPFTSDPFDSDFHDVIWPALDINAGQTVTRTFEVTVDPQTAWPTVVPDFIMENTFPGTCPPQQPACLQTTLQIPVGDLLLQKSVTFQNGDPINRPVREGEQITYTLTVDNQNSADLTNFDVLDDLSDVAFYAQPIALGAFTPAGGQYGTCDLNGDGSADPDSLCWLSQTVLAGTSADFEVTVEIKPRAQWPDPNDPVLTASNANDFLLTNTYGDTVEVDILNSEITVIKEAITPAVTAVGQEVQFDITLENTGDLPIFGLQIRDIYETDFLDFAPTGVIDNTQITDIPAFYSETEIASGSLDRLTTDPIAQMDPAGILCWKGGVPTPSGSTPDCHDGTNQTPIGNIFDPANYPTAIQNETHPTLGTAEPALIPGESITISTYYVATQETGGREALNEVYVWADDGFPNPQLETGDEASITINAIPLTIEKTVNPTSIRVNAPDADRTVTYTITLTNNGTLPVNAGTYQVRDVLPNTDFIYQAFSSLPVPLVATAPGEPSTPNVNKLLWDSLPAIPAGLSYSFQFDVQVDADETGSPYTNTARAEEFGTNDLIDEATVDLEVLPAATITDVTKTANPTSVMVTDPAPRLVTYTIEIDNTGGEVVNNVQIEDVLPLGLVYYPAGGATPPPTNVSADQRTLTWGNITIPANSVYTIMYAVNVETTVPGIYFNTVTIEDEFGDDPRLNPVPPIETPIEVIGDAPFTVTKVANPTEIDDGDAVSYTITVENISPTDTLATPDVVIQDILPADFTYNNDATLTMGALTEAFPPDPLPTNNPAALNWTLPYNLAPGGIVEITYSSLAPDPLPIGSYTNLVSVSYDRWDLDTSSTVYKPDPGGDPGPTPTPETGNQLWVLWTVLSVVGLGYGRYVYSRWEGKYE